MRLRVRPLSPASTDSILFSYEKMWMQLDDPKVQRAIVFYARECVLIRYRFTSTFCWTTVKKKLGKARAFPNV